MADIDWATTAAWIVLGANILSPIVVAIINNYHERKMYLLRKREEKRLKAISDYMSTLSKVVAEPWISELTEYVTKYGELSAYIPPEAMDDVDRLHEMIVKNCYKSGSESTSEDREEMMALYIRVRGHFYNHLKP